MRAWFPSDVTQYVPRFLRTADHTPSHVMPVEHPLGMLYIQC